MFSNMQILHLHSAGTKFNMKVLAVCLMAAALVGMVASTSLKKIKGKTLLNVVEGEEAISTPSTSSRRSTAPRA